MSKRLRIIVLTGLAVVAAACGVEQVGVADSSPAEPSTTVSSPAGSTTIEVEPTTTRDVAAIEDYLVEISNLDGDLFERLSRFEQDYNDDFWGSADVDPNDPSEDDLLRNGQGYFVGTFELILEYVDLVAAVETPPNLISAHQEYVTAYRKLNQHLRDTVAGFTSFAEAEEFFRAMSGDPSADMPEELELLNTSYMSACQNLEKSVQNAGYEFELGCPEPPLETVQVEVEVGGPWSASVDALPSGEVIAEFVFTNVGDETIRLAIVSVFDGDPTRLPVKDGLVDLRRSAITEPGFTGFYLVHPDDREGEDSPTPVAPDLRPGEVLMLNFTVSGSDIVVILDNRPGEYEAGSYLVIEGE